MGASKKTAGDKLRWIEAVAFDSRATDFDSRVATCISSQINPMTGKAIISQAAIAAKIDCTDRAVRTSTERMATLGHLWIDRSESKKRGEQTFGGAGRGKANIYVPNLAKPGAADPHSDLRMRSLGSEKEDRDNAKRGMPTRESRNASSSLSTDLHTYSFGPVPSAAEGAAGTGRHPDGEIWKAILANLERQLGADVMASWSCRIDLISIDEIEIQLSAPTKYVQQQITNRFELQIIRAVRSLEGRQVSRLKVNLRNTSGDAT